MLLIKPLSNHDALEPLMWQTSCRFKKAWKDGGHFLLSYWIIFWRVGDTLGATGWWYIAPTSGWHQRSDQLRSQRELITCFLFVCLIVLSPGDSTQLLNFHIPFPSEECQQPGLLTRHKDSSNVIFSSTQKNIDSFHLHWAPPHWFFFC